MNLTADTTTATTAPIRLHVPTLEDAGYCLHQPRDTHFIIDGRKYEAGFAKDSRIEMGGPIVPGWHGWLNAAATVIATWYPTESNTDAAAGDLVAGPEGEVYRIELNPRSRSIRDADRYLLVRLVAA